MRVAIIGSGLAGLASATTLAARGYEVEVFEKNSSLGGKAAVLERNGYRFDMGPTILIQPSVLKKIFGEANRDLADYVQMVRLDPSWRCFFDDGTVMDLKDSTPEMVESLNGRRDGLGNSYRAFLDTSEKLHSISEKFFFWKPVGSIRDTLEVKGLFDSSVLRDVMQMRMGKTVSGLIHEYVGDKKTAQMLDHFVQYVGSSPDASPAILCAIGHMQTDEGIWYPIGGTRAIPEALIRLGRELGVKYTTDADVTKISLRSHARGSEVNGLLLSNGEFRNFDAIVSNEDSVRTHRELLAGTLAASSFERKHSYEPACSGVVLYLGLNRRYEHLSHHDFVFSRDPHEEFNAIYKLGIPAPDPTCYLASTSQTESSSAPAGGDALYVLVHTPYLRPNHDWRKILPGYRQVILDKLRRTAALHDIEERIVFDGQRGRARAISGPSYAPASRRHRIAVSPSCPEFHCFLLLKQNVQKRPHVSDSFAAAFVTARSSIDENKFLDLALRTGYPARHLLFALFASPCSAGDSQL